MLIIPLSAKLSKRNPPFITIGIILTNCFVFFILQAGDNERYHEAAQFYFDSGLARIEVFRYKTYLQTTEKGEISPDLQSEKDLDKDTIKRFYVKMQRDEVFLKQLQSGNIITPDQEIYSTWKNLRTQYEAKLSMIFSVRYGFKPAYANFTTALTYMFIHGNFMHILGNMVFLWLVGCVLELGYGRVLYVLLYLLTGVLSVGLYSMVYVDSTVPLVGASGAIAGLMGAYAVAYGRTKIKIFYSLGFYFNYAQATAIVLLPVWIGNEIFQLYFGSYQGIAYVAHLGGLVSGGLFGYLNSRFLGLVDTEVFKQDPKEKIPALLEDALQRIAKLDLSGARPFLDRVLEIDPENRDALTHLFNIDKLDPGGKKFHKTASRLLRHLSYDTDTPETLYNTYKEYCRISKRPGLSLNLLFRIASIFTLHGYLPEAENIMAVLLRNYPNLQKIPTGILNLARAYLKGGMSEKGKKCLMIICKEYPESPESQIARRLLQASN